MRVCACVKVATNAAESMKPATSVKGPLLLIIFKLLIFMLVAFGFKWNINITAGQMGVGTKVHSVYFTNCAIPQDIFALSIFFKPP